MKILTFGSCNIDYVYTLHHIVGVGETEMTRKFEIFPGGKGVNQAVSISKAGASVYFAGCVGCDGQILTAILQENGVDLSLLKTTEEKNGHAIIQVSEEGDNSIFIHPGSNALVTKEYVDFVLDHFGEGDILLLQNEISNVPYIVDRAYERKMCIILNPSPLNEKIGEIDFAKLSYIIVNEVEACGLSGCKEPRESLQYFQEKYPSLRVLLTLGKEGCIYKDHATEIYHPSFRVEAVDTTAAGDTFTGYFIAGLAVGDPYEKILKTASAASAITVSRKGAAPSVPYFEEVIASLDSMIPNCRKVEV